MQTCVCTYIHTYILTYTIMHIFDTYSQTNQVSKQASKYASCLPAYYLPNVQTSMRTRPSHACKTCTYEYTHAYVGTYMRTQYHHIYRQANAPSGACTLRR